MIRKPIIAGLAIVIIAAAAQAHDLFLKLDSYFLRPNSKATVKVLNGTFKESDGAVARDRVVNLSLLGPSLSPSSGDSVVWRAEEKMSVMEFQTAAPGTYVIGISTKTRENTRTGAEFNKFLEEDGMPDVLEARRKNNELEKGATQRYSKYVRAIFQVGDTLSDDYKKSLNHPIELVPQKNPYSLKTGNTIPVLCLLNGRPLSNQFLTAGWEPKDGKLNSVSVRTDEKGIAHFKLVAPGKWFVKTINMEKVTVPGLDYESKWATLTFEIK
ncbi:MAG TPA: DUF4198 domain-containing protein [Pyrinomonadaceae bacterium]|jgi:uncharacterized GH25 family protein|nr:DUF4198 domain-containing protein [Pyrinomonadaceae bacterium]